MVGNGSMLGALATGLVPKMKDDTMAPGGELGLWVVFRVAPSVSAMGRQCCRACDGSFAMSERLLQFAD